MTLKNLTLILGGARSGKSTYAETLANSCGDNIIYIATAAIGDEEMALRVKKHRLDRPASWKTLEAQTNLAVAYQSLAPNPNGVIVDCLTLLISNILCSFPENSSENDLLAAVTQELDELTAVIKTSNIPWFIVSNEVGLGLVPPYPLGRIYRDLLGRANQKLAAEASKVFFMVAGLPMQIK